MAKLGNPSTQASNTRIGITYNTAVKASVVCNLVDVGTGFSDGLGTDTMAKEIDEILENPGVLKVITPLQVDPVNKIKIRKVNIIQFKHW